jgi:hypothetical protein
LEAEVEELATSLTETSEELAVTEAAHLCTLFAGLCH